MKGFFLIKNVTMGKVKVVAEEYNNSDNKDSAVLKQKLIEILEDDFVKTNVTQKEVEKEM